MKIAYLLLITMVLAAGSPPAWAETAGAPPGSQQPPAAAVGMTIVEPSPPLPAGNVSGAEKALSIAMEASESYRPRDRVGIFDVIVGLVLVAGGPWNIPLAANYLGTRAAEVQMTQNVGELTNPFVRARSSGSAFPTDEETLFKRAVTELEIYSIICQELYDLACADSESAVRVAQRVKDPYWKAYAFTVVGEAQVNMGRVDQARQPYKDAVDFASGLDSRRIKAVVASRVLGTALKIIRAHPRDSAELYSIAAPLIAPDYLKSRTDEAFDDSVHAYALMIALSAISDAKEGAAKLRAIENEDVRKAVALQAGLIAYPFTFEPSTAEPSGGIAELLVGEFGDASIDAKVRKWCYAGTGASEFAPDGASGKPLSRLYLETIGMDVFTPQGLAKWGQTVSLLTQYDLPAARKICLPLAMLPKQPDTPILSAAADSQWLAVALPLNQGQGSVADEVNKANMRFLAGQWWDIVRTIYKLDPDSSLQVLKQTRVFALRAIGDAALLDLTSGDERQDLLKDLSTCLSACFGVRIRGISSQWRKINGYTNDNPQCIYLGSVLAAVAKQDPKKAAELIATAPREWLRRRLLRIVVSDPTLDGDTVRAVIADAPKDEQAVAYSERYAARYYVRQDTDSGVARFQNALVDTGDKCFLLLSGIVGRWPPTQGRLKDECRQEIADDLSGFVVSLAAVDEKKAESVIAVLQDPALKCQAYRVLALVIGANDNAKALPLLDQATAAAEKIDNDGDRADATSEIAVTLGKFDPGRGLGLANQLKDPGYKVWALAMLATRQPSASSPSAVEMLSAAEKEIEHVKDSKRRAYLGYVLARAWLGVDRDQVLADLDAPAFRANSW